MNKIKGGRMIIQKYILVKILMLILITGNIHAQNDPGLVETLDWIEWKLEEFGIGSYEGTYEDSKLDGLRIRSYLYKISNLNFDYQESSCKIEFIQDIVPDSSVNNFIKVNAMIQFDLKDIELVSNAFEEKTYLAKTKNRIFDQNVLKKLMLLKTVNENLSIDFSIRREKWDVENYTFTKYDSKKLKKNYLLIYIKDDDIRERLLKAFNHAAKKAKESNERKEIF